MNPLRHTLLVTALVLPGALPGWAQVATAGDPVVFGAPAGGERLADLRGGASVTVNEARLDGTTANNTAVNVQTGTNMITEGAFSNLTGIPVVIQNTGANVLIQNGVILNLQLQ
jgi:hypothetical protein